MLKGKHIFLRAIEADDLVILKKWRNDPENRQYFREWRELNSAHQREWFEQHVMSQLSPVMFAICKPRVSGYNDSIGELIGACGLTYIDWIHGSAEISIYIGEGYIDAVYCPDALEVLTEYAFKELNLHRLYIQMYAYDTMKEYLAKLCGYAYEGTMEDAHYHNGRWHDEHIYGRINRHDTTQADERTA